MRMIKFALVGLAGLVINEFLLFMLTDIFHIYYVISSIVSVEISIISNFIFHELWTFADRQRGSFAQRFLLYNIFSLSGLLVNVGLLFFFTEFFGFFYLISNILAVMVVFFWNFLMSRKWVWSREKCRIGRLNKNPIISLIIPTYNEKHNVRILVPRLFNTLKGYKFEIIFVDDNSPDGTGEVLEELKKKYRITVIHREGRKGLSSAVLDGVRVSKGEIIGIMDADLSHPPEAIPDMVKPIINGEAEVVIGSRYVGCGSIKGWSLKRKLMSKAGNILARPLTGVNDAMSGFIFFRRDVINDVKFRPMSLKIGLEILVKGNYNKAVEVPYIFVDRKFGRSKLGLRESIKYLCHLVHLYFYRINQ
ncbi:MAG: glycosyltransferase [Candidatus Aenigmarchaeota archaeon]|nr:glycosyltransferase [Candidatus Aenigmarchaeota archaeon]